ncbi:MAG: hypothetical protein ACK5BN_12835, partial [Planctomycetota bacterium]
HAPPSPPLPAAYAEQQRAASRRALHEQAHDDRSVLLTADADAVARRSELAQAEGDSALARLALFKALGGGWPAANDAPAIGHPARGNGG